jgi:hypothetical protein
MPWLEGYSYRKIVPINGAAGTGTGYPVQLEVHSGVGVDSPGVAYLDNLCTNFPNDIRFTDDDGETELGHWLESEVGGVAKFWIRINDDLGSNQNFYIYYTKAGADSKSNGHQTFDFFHDAVESFTKYAGNPIVVYDAGGDADSSVRQEEVVYAGSTYFMYYYRHLTNPDPRRIDLATSPDGYNYTKYAGNPVLERDVGSWDSDQVSFPTVLYHDGYFWMYYSSMNEVGLAKSTDGYNFTRIANGIGGTSKVLEKGGVGEFDEYQAVPHTVIYRNDLSQFWMYYRGCNGDLSHCEIGLATSPDGVNYTKYAGNPIMSYGEVWEGGYVSDVCVFWYDGKWRMFYRGNSGVNNKIGYAESTDGISWTKSSSNPLLWKSSAGWDNSFVLAPWFIFKSAAPANDGLLYYTGCSGNHNQIGVADQNSKGHFQGADVRIWEIGLIGHSGGTVSHSSDQAVYGTKSIKLVDNSGSDNIDICKLTGLSYGSKMRFISWVRCNSAARPHALWVFEGTTNFFVLLLQNNGHIYYYDSTPAWVLLPVDTTYNANTWYKIEMILDAANKKFFSVRVNNVEKGSNLAASFSGVVLNNPVFSTADIANTETEYIDGVIMAKYHSPEPTVGTPGGGGAAPPVGSGPALRLLTAHLI